MYTSAIDPESEPRGLTDKFMEFEAKNMYEAYYVLCCIKMFASIMAVRHEGTFRQDFRDEVGEPIIAMPGELLGIGSRKWHTEAFYLATSFDKTRSHQEAAEAHTMNALFKEHEIYARCLAETPDFVAGYPLQADGCSDPNELYRLELDHAIKVMSSPGRYRASLVYMMCVAERYGAEVPDDLEARLGSRLDDTLTTKGSTRESREKKYGLNYEAATVTETMADTVD